MNILYGLFPPDEGEIIIRGMPTKISSPREAINLGIGMVHQHFKLISTHTVSENIILGLASTPFFLSRRKSGIRNQVSLRKIWFENRSSSSYLATFSGREAKS